MEKYVNDESINIFYNLYYGNRSSFNLVDYNYLMNVINNNPNNPEIVALRKLCLCDIEKAKNNILPLEKTLNKSYYTDIERKLNIYKDLPLDFNDILNVSVFSRIFNHVKEPTNYFDFIKDLSNDVNLIDRNSFTNKFKSFCDQEGLSTSLTGENYSRIQDYPSDEIIKDNFENLDYNNYSSKERRIIIGQYGELKAKQYLQKNLGELGLEEAKERVLWVPKYIGDGLGYDLLSFDELLKDLLVEVKATKLYSLEKKDDSFIMSYNEVLKMVELSQEHKYRVFRTFILPDLSARFLFLKFDKDEKTSLKAHDGSIYKGYEIMDEYGEPRIKYQRVSGPKLVFKMN